MTLLMASCRIRVGAGAEELEHVLDSDRPAVLAFWHGRMVVCGHLIYRRIIRRGGAVALLTSLSRDGELAAALGRARNYRTVRGSTSRGGLSGMLRLYRAVARDGCSVAIAPDGPRGPALECQPGTVMLARLAGAPIIPLAYAASRSWRLRSWDRLVVPRPFARVVVTVGEPLEVPAEAADEELARLSTTLKHRLDELVGQAEELL
jgi:lysophospholipid acyltransferase (LPLAT)-like uncharacterized protein